MVAIGVRNCVFFRMIDAEIGEFSFSFRKLCPKPEPVGMQHIPGLKIWICHPKALICAKRLTASHPKLRKMGPDNLGSWNRQAPRKGNWLICKAKVRTLYIRQQSERPSHSSQHTFLFPLDIRCHLGIPSVESGKGTVASWAEVCMQKNCCSEVFRINSPLAWLPYNIAQLVEIVCPETWNQTDCLPTFAH